MADNYPTLAREINTQNQEAEQILNRLNPRKSTPNT